MRWLKNMYYAWMLSTLLESYPFHDLPGDPTKEELLEAIKGYGRLHIDCDCRTCCMLVILNKRQEARDGLFVDDLERFVIFIGVTDASSGEMLKDIGLEPVYDSERAKRVTQTQAETFVEEQFRA